jgi:hypothetical protein
MSNGIGPQNGIPAGQFGESSRAGNKSEIEPGALSYFLRLRSGSRKLQEITPLKGGCISRLNPNSNPSTSDVNVSLADLRDRIPHLPFITPFLSRGLAVESAAEKGNLEAVEGLLQRGPISDKNRGLAVMSAAQNGHTEIIEMLLQNGPINEEASGLAVMSAAQNGYIEVIDRLLQDGPINEEASGLAVMIAARNGYIEVIDRLLQDGARIPLHYLNEAVFLLAEVGLDLPVLNALVDNAPLANHFEDGINVHNGQRDDKTRAALELLWKHTKGLEIEKHFRSCLSYLQGLPESGKKTLALKALSGPREAIDNFPPLLDKESFSCNRFSLTGKELIGRLWGFISGCDENNQHECKEGMVTALSTSFEHGSLVCNQGKTQRLLIAVLQGRLEGVQIDDLAPVLSPDQALRFFLDDKQRQLINKKEDLLAKANRFLEDNPIVHRESFMAKLEDYWKFREPEQEEAVQGGDDLE